MGTWLWSCFPAWSSTLSTVYGCTEMPPLANVPKELAISIGLTTEAPRPSAKTGSRSERIPALWASSTTTGGPIFSIRRIEQMLRDAASARRKVIVPRNLPSKLPGTQILKSGDCANGAVARLIEYWSVAPSKRRQSRRHNNRRGLSSAAPVMLDCSYGENERLKRRLAGGASHGAVSDRIPTSDRARTAPDLTSMESVPLILAGGMVEISTPSGPIGPP